jgi:hypothetical protein
MPEIAHKYVITLDTDPQMEQSIRTATGMETKWFNNSESFQESELSWLFGVHHRRVGLNPELG